MVETIVGLGVAAAILNYWSFKSQNNKTKRNLFWVVEGLLVVIIIFATVYANK